MLHTSSHGQAMGCLLWACWRKVYYNSTTLFMKIWSTVTKWKNYVSITISIWRNFLFCSYPNFNKAFATPLFVTWWSGMALQQNVMMTSLNGNIFSHYWPFMRRIHWSPMNSPHKGRWCTALMFSLICTWINGWVSNHKADDLRCHCAHYDFTVMELLNLNCNGKNINEMGPR